MIIFAACFSTFETSNKRETSKRFLTEKGFDRLKERVLAEKRFDV